MAWRGVNYVVPPGRVCPQPVKGVNPPPTVTPVPSEGYLCPEGKEHDTLEWELARWIVENKVCLHTGGFSVCLSASLPVRSVPGAARVCVRFN